MVAPLRNRGWLIVAVGLLGCLPTDSAGAAGPARDEQELANRIDALLEAALKEEGIPLASPASDAEFLRRVCLDLTGRIPSVSQARDFLDAERPDRHKLVDSLLASPLHAQHSAQTWRAFLVPQAGTNPLLQYLGVSLEAWLRQRIREGARYDQIARDLLTAPLDYQGTNLQAPDLVPGLSALGYYQASDLLAETVAATTGRALLGLKIECAQCHNHPFAPWTQRQFWELAGFFAGVPPQGPNEKKLPAIELVRRRTLPLPGTDQKVSARFLDGKEPNWDSQPDPRQALAEWITAPDNPYFARTAVNRLWSLLFGVGLVDPITDFGEHNLPSHPEVLDELARAFIAHKYDTKFLLRALTQTRAYQRSSVLSHSGQADPRKYARMNVKGLSPEQLFDSVAQATGYRDPLPLAARTSHGYQADTPRGQYLAKFGGGSERSDQQTSILQALTLMNGDWISQQTSPTRGELLRAVADAPFLDEAGRVEVLFLAALSRHPTSEEKQLFLAHVRSAADQRRGLGNVLWVLLNRTEFLVNH
jgi:hypothetical protein